MCFEHELENHLNWGTCWITSLHTVYSHGAVTTVMSLLIRLSCDKFTCDGQQIFVTVTVWFGTLQWVFPNLHSDEDLWGLCAVCACKHDVYLRLHKMFTIDTEDICVYSIIKKWNKNKNRSVRLSYADPKFEFTSRLISKTSVSTGTVL